MKVIICGGGRVGYNVAKYLSQDGATVSVIDANEDVLQSFSSLDVQTVHGSATYIPTLEKAGAQDADVILAVTRSDELNMLICQIASSVFSTKQKMARIRDQEYLSYRWSELFSPLHIPVDMVISPEYEVAEYIYENISYTGTFDIFSAFDNKLRSVATRCKEGAPFDQMPIKLLPQSYKDLPIKIIAITRKETTSICNDETVIKSGDIVHFIIEEKFLYQAMHLFGYDHTPVKQVIIVGGGAVGYLLANLIEGKKCGINLKIIEQNRARAEYIAPRLKHTIILNGSALDPNLLIEANISDTDTVVSVTNDERTNILTSILAKEYPVERTLSLVNTSTYDVLSSNFKVDALIHPHKITISNILRYIRRQQAVKPLHSLLDKAWELMEISVHEHAEGNGLSVQDIFKQTYGKIVCIMRNFNIVFPTSEERIMPEDKLLVLIKTQHRKKIENIFRTNYEFF